MSGRRRLQVAALVCVGLLLPAPGAKATPDGDRPSVYEATAEAIIARGAVHTFSLLPVPAPVDVGGHYATSSVSSLGTVTAFGALPYPGDVVLSGPGLAAGLLGIDLPSEATSYPLGASASHPLRPDAEVEAGATRVTAHAEDGASTATARSGPPDVDVGSAHAFTRTAVVDHGVTSEATVQIDGMAIGPLVIGRLTSSATVRAVPDQPAESETTFSLTGLSVGGVPVQVDESGLSAGGTTTALPGVDRGVQEALAAAGMTVRVHPADDAEEGAVRSAALEIRFIQTLEEGVTGVVPAGQPVETRILLGQARAAASATGLAPLEGAAPLLDEGGAVPTDAGSTDAAAEIADAGPPAPGATSPSTGPAPSRSAPAELVAEAAVARNGSLPSKALLYPLLVAASLGAFAAATTSTSQRPQRRRQGARTIEVP